MQSEFQNEVVLPRKTREVHFIISLNIFSHRNSIIRTSTYLDTGSQLVLINGVLLHLL
jgi:hypothetical protein